MEKILGQERYKRLLDVSTKLGFDPESMLRDIVDMKICGTEELNSCQNLKSTT